MATTNFRAWGIPTKWTLLATKTTNSSGQISEEIVIPDTAREIAIAAGNNAQMVPIEADEFANLATGWVTLGIAGPNLHTTCDHTGRTISTIALIKSSNNSAVSNASVKVYYR